VRRGPGWRGLSTLGRGRKGLGRSRGEGRGGGNLQQPGDLGDGGAYQHMQLPGGGGRQGTMSSGAPRGSRRERAMGYTQELPRGALQLLRARGSCTSSTTNSTRSLNLCPLLLWRQGTPSPLPWSCLQVRWAPATPLLTSTSFSSSSCTSSRCTSQCSTSSMSLWTAALPAAHTMTGVWCTWPSRALPQGPRGVPVTYQKALDGQSGAGGQSQASPAPPGAHQGGSLCPLRTVGTWCTPLCSPG